MAYSELMKSFHRIRPYDKNDETEILIRILSFGAVVRVTAPESFREKIRQRLAMQSQY